MSLYLEQIRQLVELQHVDDKIYAVKKELEEAPLQVESLRERFNEEEAKIAKIQDKLQHMYEQQKRLDMDLEDENARLKKSKSKLMQVGNSKEFQAMSREMDNMERSSKTHEEERIALREEITAHEEMLKDAEAVRDELKIDLAAKEESLNERIAAANEELEKLNAIHEATGKDVPERILERYDFIRRRLEHPVIVPVKNSVCTGCNIAIPPQTFNEIQRGQQIWSCPNCQRLIYWAEHFQDEHQEEKKAKIAKPQVFAEDLNLGESLN